MQLSRKTWTPDLPRSCVRSQPAGMVGSDPERIRFSSRAWHMGERFHEMKFPPGIGLLAVSGYSRRRPMESRKARLVIKGYRQKHGIDYHETFAAVSRMDSVRSIVASAVLRGWKLHQFDAVTAFLHGDVDSSIYMELPEGFEEARIRLPTSTLLVRTEAGPTDLVPMRPPCPGSSRLHHGPVRQLCLL